MQVGGDSKSKPHPLCDKAEQSLWRNRLARSAVNRKVGGSSPPRDVGSCVYITSYHLKMATKTNRIGKIVTLRREVPRMTEVNRERDPLYSALLACGTTNQNLLTFCYIVNFSKNSFPSI